VKKDLQKLKCHSSRAECCKSRLRSWASPVPAGTVTVVVFDEIPSSSHAVKNFPDYAAVAKG